MAGRSRTLSQTIDHHPNILDFGTCDVCFNFKQHCSCVKCLNCFGSLEVPFIECGECDRVTLCLRCFSKGSESTTHKSYHRYRVMTHDIVLFEQSNWTAEEELVMLNVLFTYGYGNWELISKKLRNRTEKEIKEHYDRFYLDEPVSELPKVCNMDQSMFPKPVIPYG